MGPNGTLLSVDNENIKSLFRYTKNNFLLSVRQSLTRIYVFMRLSIHKSCLFFQKNLLIAIKLIMINHLVVNLTKIIFNPFK